MSLLQYFSVSYFGFFGHKACETLVPWKGGHTHTPCTGKQNPKHWPAREVPHLFIFKLILLEYTWFAMLCYFPYLQCLEQGVSQSRCSQKHVTSKDIRITSRPRIPLPAPFCPRMSLLHPCPPWLLNSLKSCIFYCL